MRAALILLVCAGTASAASTELPSHAGMYAPGSGGSAAPAALAMLDSHVEVSVHGAIAEVVIHQRFRNDSDHVTEATYIFPLPEDAAVTAMSIATGTRTIHAAIEKRAEAQRRYEEAVSAGQSAALLEEERPDVFTQTVSAIPARGTVDVVLRYDTLARPRGDGTWQLALPMVVAPRYVPGTASGRPTTGAGHAPDTDRSPDASRVTPGAHPGAGGSTEIVLAFADGVDGVTSPTHELAARGAGFALADPRSDHDAILRWRGKQPDAGWSEQDDDGGYAAVVVSAPPAKPRAAGGAALDIALVLDRSALAHGDADAAMRPIVRELLADLTPADAVAVTGSANVTRQAPADAWRELDRGWSSSPGAFDLTRALAAAHGGAIVLVTPGLVADDAAALAAARALRVPVHVVGVGPAPNRALLGAIAAATGGTVRFVAPDDDAPAIARDVVADLATAPAVLAVNWGTLAASDVVPATLPRLGAGQARLVLARVQKVQAANARARGDVFAIAMTTKEPAVGGELTTRGPLARRWARDRLGELLASGAPDVAAITAHALRYGLVSPYTSMVAIGDEVVVRGGVRHTVSVPVSVPAGMRWQPLERELHVVTKAEEQADKNGDVDRARKQNQHVAGAGGDEDEDVKKAPKGKHMPVTTPKKPEAPPHKTPPSHRPPQDTAGAPSPVAPSAPPPPVASRPPSTDNDADGVADSDDAETAQPQTRVATVDHAYGGEVLVSDESVATSRRRIRLGLALGAGLSLGGNTDGLVAATARLETGGSLRYGGEASLWLVGGLHLEGDVLGTLAYGRGPFEIGGGLGVHVAGDGVGPALAAVLRYALTPHLWAYLRYDGALLRDDGKSHGEHATSAGVEWRW